MDLEWFKDTLKKNELCGGKEYIKCQIQIGQVLS